MKTIGRNRRGEISSPIILILLTVAAIAVAGIAVVWMSTVSTNAASQASLVVVGTPTVTSNGAVFITVKNLGNTAATVTSIRIGSGTWTGTQSISSGSSKDINITLSGGSYTQNTAYSGVLQSDAGTLTFRAYCIG